MCLQDLVHAAPNVYEIVQDVRSPHDRSGLPSVSSAGVIQTEEGPRQRLNFQYEDAYHRHDPASGTNIRFFQPRSEEVIVPLQTD